jgi:hypothetical protein
MAPKIVISLEDVSEDHKNRYLRTTDLPPVQVSLDGNLFDIGVTAVAIEVDGKTASVGINELEAALKAIRAVAQLAELK